MTPIHPPLIQLSFDDPLPNPELAWGQDTVAPGLLAVGGGLSVERLIEAYGQACFPWYSDGQPVMWWSTDPRMVLSVDNFRLHKSLRKHLSQLLACERIQIKVNHDFSKVIHLCSTSVRKGQNGTWIVDEMIDAYEHLHQAGFAHSIETWVDGEMRGGLYLVSIGKAVFGESMFALDANTSKIALAALVCICKVAKISMIDCQQNTRHLASLGAQEMPRKIFHDHVVSAKYFPNIDWQFDPLYWKQLLPDQHSK